MSQIAIEFDPEVDEDDEPDWFCADCKEGFSFDDQQWTPEFSHPVCDDCYQTDYFTCESCEYIYRNDESVEAESEIICERCRDRYYRWCDECSVYYHYESDSHIHEKPHCECEPPRPFFAFPLANGEFAHEEDVVTVTTDGMVTTRGYQEVALILEDLIRPIVKSQWYSTWEWLATRVIPEREWSTVDGKWPTRLCRVLYRNYQIKVPSDLKANIGTVASANRMDEGTNYLHLTRNLNESPEYFGNEDSCWWNPEGTEYPYEKGRCTFKAHGGIGIRSVDTADNADQYCPNGRAWLMPVCEDFPGTWKGEHDPTKADGFVVFNAYGDMDEQRAGLLVSTLTGLPYRKIYFSASNMYINTKGYLIAPQDILDRTDEIHLDLTKHWRAA